MIKVDYDKLQHKIGEKLIRCPICGKNSFVLDSNLLSPININDGNINIGTSLMPLVAITCTNCGHVMFFNAKALGCLDET